MIRASVVTPERLAKSGTENANQAALFCYFQQNIDKYPLAQLLFAIPNGGLRDKVVAAKLKTTGVKAGVPDMFLPVARGDFHGLFIELKKDQKQPKSAAQDMWLNDLHNEGYECVLCFGWQHAVETIIQYLEHRE
jgi:hypothetical protein